MLCSGERFILAGVVVGCVCQGLLERLVVWCGKSLVAVPIRGVVSLYGGEVVEGEGVSGDLVLILGSLVAEVVSGPAPSPPYNNTTPRIGTATTEFPQQTTNLSRKT